VTKSELVDPTGKGHKFSHSSLGNGITYVTIIRDRSTRKRKMSKLRWLDGRTINCERGKGNNHDGFDKRLQRNNPGAREA
jgi:hypothetical protein